jgi:hypothetical protein
MSDDIKAEMQHWQARCDEMQVAIERIREERDAFKFDKEALAKAYAVAADEALQLRSMVSRLEVALAQGQEL